MSSLPAVLGGAPMLQVEAGIVRPSFADYTDNALLEEIRDVLVSNQVTNGVRVRQLEEGMAAYLGVEHVVAVSSCTLGLTLALRAAGVVNREVIVPSFTIAATVDALYWNGCMPVFADIDPATFNISVSHVKTLITERTGAIMPVHVFGNPVHITEIEDLARRHGIPVVYDAAQGFGASYSGQKLGRFGLFEVFSGSPTKHFSSAEGGFVATNDKELADKVRLARNYGVLPNYDCVIPGLNARMPEINGVIGARMLPETDGFIAARHLYAAAYREILGEVPGLAFQEMTPNSYSSYNYLGLVIEPAQFGLTNRELAAALKHEHVATKVYYHPPVHQMQVFRSNASLPNTEALADRIICLPIYNAMEPALVEAISKAVVRVQRHADAVHAALSGKVLV